MGRHQYLNEDEYEVNLKDFESQPGKLLDNLTFLLACWSCSASCYNASLTQDPKRVGGLWLPDLWVPAAVQITPEPRSVTAGSLCAPLEAISGWSPWRWTFLCRQMNSSVWSEQAENCFYNGSYPSWVSEGKAIVWSELLDLVSEAEPGVPKQLEKVTRGPGQRHRTCQNVEKGELKLL